MKRFLFEVAFAFTVIVAISRCGMFSKVNWLYQEPPHQEFGMPLDIDPNFYFLKDGRKYYVGFREDGVVVWKNIDK